MTHNQDITVRQLKELMEGGEKINLYDVRDQHEFDEDNLGAELLPLGDIGERYGELEPLKNEDIYLHCRSGARSGRAKQFLESKGYTKVHNVLGGILAYREMGE